jgi:hypothetical protein
MLRLAWNCDARGSRDYARTAANAKMAIEEEFDNFAVTQL